VQDKDLVHSRLKQVQQNPLLLSKVASCESQELPYNSATFSIMNQGTELLIRGKDLTGNAWNAILPVTGLGCDIFQADLDGNGQQDLIIYAPGIGDKGSYDTHLTILLFDRNAKPYPWQAIGRFTLTNGGIQEIFKDSSGSVAIVQTSEIGLPAWGGISFLSYLYHAKDNRIVKASESYAGIKFPYLVKASSTDIKIEQIAQK
jgi:hypothetical protein